MELLVPNIVRVIKSRRLRWAAHVARMEERMSTFNILTGKPAGKRPFGRTILEWILKKGLGLIRLRIGIIGELL